MKNKKCHVLSWRGLVIVLLVLLGCREAQAQLPPGWDTPIGGAAAADAQPTIPLDAGAADTQPIGAGITTPVAEAQPTIPLDAGAVDTQPIGAGIATPAAADQNTPQQNPEVDANTQPIGAGTTTPAAANQNTPQQNPGVDANTQPIGAGTTTPAAADQNNQQPAQATQQPAQPAEQNPVLDAGAAQTQPIGADADPQNVPATDSTIPGSQIPTEVESEEEEGTEPVVEEAPAPPKNWEFLPQDKTMIFGLEVTGPSLVPWTKTKSWNFVQTLHEFVLPSTRVNDIEVGVTDSYRTQVEKETPGSEKQYDMESGIQMRVAVNTNSIRVESEVRSLIQAIQSGKLAEDLSIALGTDIENITMITDPEILPYDSVADPNESTGGSLPGWIIGAIVGGIIILIPIPAYLLYKRSKRKHIEALAKQQAEAAAARQRMQSRIIKSTGGKSFSYQEGDNLSGLENGQEIYPSNLPPLNTPGSVTGRQYSGNWHSRSNSGFLEPQRSNSQLGTPGYAGNSPTRAWQQQQQRALYQQNSLGPGGMPPVNRVASYTNGRHASGSVYPVRYSGSGSPSSSSGNLSEPRR
ncbi:hypothetical protein M9434_005295 [Picochlorum sp. BPE23]|nr:hypothetical protein M9434_005295 [Picochlorum sp. BPE23]